MDRSWSSVIPKDLLLNMPTPLYLSKMLFTDVQLLLYSKKKTTTTTLSDSRGRVLTLTGTAAVDFFQSRLRILRFTLFAHTLAGTLSIQNSLLRSGRCIVTAKPGETAYNFGKTAQFELPQKLMKLDKTD